MMRRKIIFYVMHHSHELGFDRSEIKIFSIVRHTRHSYGRWWVDTLYGNPGPDIVEINPAPLKMAI